ncbi:hypothetical protein BHE74_00018877 [Ensete ventricosum]|nr:hypothetical protein BHE74_00018877 [Ensete ventricosum]
MFVMPFWWVQRLAVSWRRMCPGTLRGPQGWTTLKPVLRSLSFGKVGPTWVFVPAGQRNNQTPLHDLVGAVHVHRFPHVANRPESAQQCIGSMLSDRISLLVQ